MSGLLAASPSAFSRSGDVVTIPHRVFADQWKRAGRLIPHVQKTAGGLVLELPLLELSRYDHYLMAIGCGRREDVYDQSQHCLGIVVCMGADGRYQRLSGIEWVDAGRLRTPAHAFTIGKLETVEETVPQTLHM